MLRRLTILSLGLVALASVASAQTRVAGTDSTGNVAPVAAFGGGLVTTGGDPSFATVSQASATTTEVVALTSGQSIYISGFILSSVGAAGPPTIKFVYGTGANCGSGTTDLTPVFTGSTTAGDIAVFSYGNGAAYVLKVPVSNALCVTSTTTSPQRGLVTYKKL
jgi:hypothetical protein